MYIDGTFRQNVNLYVSGSRQVQQAVYSITTLSAGSHTIKIVNRSTAYACIDAFRLYGADTSAAAVINTIAAGAFLPYNQTAGVYQGAAPSASRPYGRNTYKAMNRVVLDKRFSGRAATVAVYNLAGKLVSSKATRKTVIDLRKEFGITDGTYIVKIEAKHQ